MHSVNAPERNLEREGEATVSGTSLVILAMYSAVNVVGPAGKVETAFQPYLLALLLAAVAMTCLATVALYEPPQRNGAKGATIRKARRFSGPAPRRH